MSEKMRRAFEELVMSTEENTPKVEGRLIAAGVELNSALIHSAAKYFTALDKLAKE